MTALQDNGSRRLDIRTGEDKLSGRQTSKNHAVELRGIRQAMAAELEIALRALAKMDPQAMATAGKLIAALRSIKTKIEERARAFGYSETCRQAIAVCAGECCRWHFPKRLSRVDFFAAVFNLPEIARVTLIEQVRASGDGVYQCPLLQRNGCIFSFEHRPAVCTAAYPCLAGSDYWAYKESFRKELTKLRKDLGALIDTFGIDVSD